MYFVVTASKLQIRSLPFCSYSSWAILRYSLPSSLTHNSIPIENNVIGNVYENTTVKQFLAGFDISQNGKVIVTRNGNELTENDVIEQDDIVEYYYKNEKVKTYQIDEFAQVSDITLASSNAALNSVTTAGTTLSKSSAVTLPAISTAICNAVLLTTVTDTKLLYASFRFLTALSISSWLGIC